MGLPVFHLYCAPGVATASRWAASATRLVSAVELPSAIAGEAIRSVLPTRPIARTGRKRRDRREEAERREKRETPREIRLDVRLAMRNDMGCRQNIETERDTA